MPHFTIFQPGQRLGGNEESIKNKRKDVIIGIDPNTGRGKRLQICEDILHTGAKLYEPTQIREKVEDHGLEVLYIKPTTLAYFLIGQKSIQK